MRRVYVLIAIFVVTAGVFGAGCAARHDAQHSPMMHQELGPGPLLPIDATSPDFFAEHAVEIRWAENSRRFRAVVQKRGDLLELILLGPMQAPVVRVFQKGETVGVERITSRPLPFEPEYLLADVQKAFLPWVARDAGTVDGDSMVHHGERDTLHWQEVTTDDRIKRRSFWRGALGENVRLTVTYAYDDNSDMPSTVTLDNTWLQYTLHIETLRWAPL